MNVQKAKTLIAVFLVILFCLLITTNFFNFLHIENKIYSMWFSKVEFWITILLLYIYASKIEKSNFLLWEEQKKKLLFYSISVAALLLIIAVLLTSISVIKNFAGVTQNDEILNRVNDTWSQSWSLFIFSAITAAVTEELIFRGYLLPRIKLLTGNAWLSILISSAIFGLAHYTYEDFTRMLFPFIIGLVFSVFYYRYRSLITLIICHLIIDLALF